MTIAAGITPNPSDTCRQTSFEAALDPNHCEFPNVVEGRNKILAKVEVYREILDAGWRSPLVTTYVAR